MANFDFANLKQKLTEFTHKFFSSKTSNAFGFYSALGVFLSILLLAGIGQLVLNLINQREIYTPLETALEYSLYGFLLTSVYLVYKFRETKFLSGGVFANSQTKNLLAIVSLLIISVAGAYHLSQNLEARREVIASLPKEENKLSRSQESSTETSKSSSKLSASSSKDSSSTSSMQSEDNSSVISSFENQESWLVVMQIANFGDLEIELKKEYAPKTVENFLLLSERGLYDNTTIHRIVENEGFAVIQGGDYEKGDGTGGKSAFYVSDITPNLIPDELWLVEPEFENTDRGSVLVNQPKFRNSDFYQEFDPEIGAVTYPKGLILMAKTALPDSASSQFFITLEDTTLPAQYTAFGKVQNASLSVLDSISSQVNPITGNDGEPDQELKIKSVKISD